MRVLFVGLGKLGLPVALALRAAGHEVRGVERDELRTYQITQNRLPEALQEPHVRDLLHQFGLPVFSDQAYATRAWKPEVVLIAVQTPHQPQFEGITPLAEAPEDFNYTYLESALAETVRTFGGKDPESSPLVVTISTCLPGTYDRYLRFMTAGLRYAYNPFFIAMGTVIEDFRNPEFILVGTNNGRVPPELQMLYWPILDQGSLPRGGNCFSADEVWARFFSMSITSAELTKVAYNAFIGQKLMLANSVAMICDCVGADADDVMGALGGATDRLVSRRYLRPGMGDGGACHPRDQIALSWLAQALGLPHDPYDPIVKHREGHARWLARIWWQSSKRLGRVNLPLVMLGSAYKPNSSMTTGSHALLVTHYAKQFADVRVEDGPFTMERACFFLGCPHDHFLEKPLPVGSVLVDPWGLYPETDGVEIVKPGRRADHGRSGVSGMRARIRQEGGRSNASALHVRAAEVADMGAGERSGEDR